jgi:AcrR family transcriptional regulator
VGVEVRTLHETDMSVRSSIPLKCKRVRIWYASGEVEYQFEQTLPEVGSRLGRNGSEGFVTRVHLEGPDDAVVTVGTPAPDGVIWDDVASSSRWTARERLLDAAYELFSHRGIRAVGTEEILDAAGVSRSTLYRLYGSKETLVLAFLQRREHRWTREFVEAEARRRGSTPRERLLAIFDVFDEWFHRDDFEGCSFINVLLEMGPEGPVGDASVAHLEYIRSVVARLAEEAGVRDPVSFARSWHILMKGSIVSAGEGDVLAARRAREMGEDLLDKHLAAPVSDPV